MRLQASVARIPIPNSTMFERRSKKYNDTEGRSLEWERVVTGTEHMHSAFIILNI
jgi:hypothetical protein